MRYVFLYGIRMFAVFFFCMAASCGSNSVSSNSDSSGQPAAQSTLARDTSPQVSDADLQAVVAGNTEFALKVFPLLETTPDDNTFFSPYSITQAFALLAPGARGTTLGEIEQTLSFLPQDRLNPALNKLDLFLTENNSGTVLPGALQSPTLSNANAVWGQEGFPILPEYLDTLAVNYGADLHTVDFINDTENSRQTINTWVESKTNNRIQDLIPKDGITSATRLVLTNAIWFKGDWASQFRESNTQDLPFTNRDGSTSVIPLMSQWFHVPYAKLNGCQAVDIPYVGHNLSMLVIMPDPGNFDQFLSALTPAVVSDITNNLSTKYVDFSMPKFSFKKATEMTKNLMSLGMTEAFDSTRADFSGIDGRRDLYVGNVFHQAFVSVDEAGTEAAAATAIVVALTGVPSAPDLTVSIDHPFIFLIRDRQTGLIIFLGKVASLH